MLKPSMQDFKHDLTSMGDECSCPMVSTFFGITLLGNWNEDRPFLVHQGRVDFPCTSDGKGSSCNAGAPGSTPGSGRSLEKGMAIHSSILAWRIPWTEEPGGLQFVGSQRVGND